MNLALLEMECMHTSCYLYASIDGYRYLSYIGALQWLNLETFNFIVESELLHISVPYLYN